MRGEETRPELLGNINFAVGSGDGSEPDQDQCQSDGADSFFHSSMPTVQMGESGVKSN